MPIAMDAYDGNLIRINNEPDRCTFILSVKKGEWPNQKQEKQDI